MSPQPGLVELWRSGLKGAVDLMKVSLENAERLQNQQLIAIGTALDDQVGCRARPGEGEPVWLKRAVERRAQRAEHALVVRARPEHAAAAGTAHEALVEL